MKLKAMIAILLLFTITLCSCSAKIEPKVSQARGSEAAADQKSGNVSSGSQTAGSETSSSQKAGNAISVSQPAGSAASSNQPGSSDNSQILLSNKTVTSSAALQTDSTDPSKAYEQAAEKILKNMTLEEKVGQMFFVRLPEASAKNDIKTYHLGGYILFGNNFKDKTKASIKNELADFQKTSKIPMLIGVDEEGGSVNRISKYTAFRSQPFKSPQELYKLGGLNLISKDTVEKAKLLKSLGINVNLAPVSDVSVNSSDFIYNRSFGKNALSTSRYVTTVVGAMKDMHIGSTLKHFPGYGNNVDTHTGSAIDSRSRKSFESSDFLPFKAGIKAGADSILVSHNIVKAFDKNLPASLSPAVHTILRKDLSFNGVIMTDDLSMGAISKYTSKESVILAVKAGNDIILTSDYKTQIPAVISAVKNKTIPMASINEATLRVIKWKLSLGILSEK